jgi:membrane protein implicated in regulation of membrane protease activity
MKYSKFLSFFGASHSFEMPELWYVWLIASFIFLIMELGHPGLFYFISFFFGGLSAAILSYLMYDIHFQMISFFVGSIIAFFILQRFAVALTKHSAHQQTNFYTLKGKRAIVRQEISFNKGGLVVVNGQVWAARSIYQDDCLSVGVIVEIVDVRGAHLVVKKV